MSDTPRTGDALESILREKRELSEDTAPRVLVQLCRTLERENAAMREQIEHLGKANSMLHLEIVDAHAETAKETRRADAMREAIKEADGALRKCLNYMLILPMSGSDAECEAMDDSHHALSKLQPFLKP